MKLKEKLANDYYYERPEGFGNPTDDFLAGFEKAREMATKLAEQEGINSPNESYEAACTNISIGLERLGEQDVN